MLSTQQAALVRSPQLGYSHSYTYPTTGLIGGCVGLALAPQYSHPRQCGSAAMLQLSLASGLTCQATPPARLLPRCLTHVPCPPPLLPCCSPRGNSRLPAPGREGAPLRLQLESRELGGPHCPSRGEPRSAACLAATRQGGHPPHAVRGVQAMRGLSRALRRLQQVSSVNKQGDLMPLLSNKVTLNGWGLQACNNACRGKLLLSCPFPSRYKVAVFRKTK